MFESRGINFRIVAWNFGQTVNDRTKVVMQGLSINEEELYNVEKEIMAFCKGEDVACIAVKGPSFEKPLDDGKHFLQDME